MVGQRVVVGSANPMTSRGFFWQEGFLRAAAMTSNPAPSQLRTKGVFVVQKKTKLEKGDRVPLVYSRHHVIVEIVGESETLYRLKIVEAPSRRFIGLLLARNKTDFQPVKTLEWF